MPLPVTAAIMAVLQFFWCEEAPHRRLELLLQITSGGANLRFATEQKKIVTAQVPHKQIFARSSSAQLIENLRDRLYGFVAALDAFFIVERFEVIKIGVSYRKRPAPRQAQIELWMILTVILVQIALKKET